MTIWTAPWTTAIGYQGFVFSVNTLTHIDIKFCIFERYIPQIPLIYQYLTHLLENTNICIYRYTKDTYHSGYLSINMDTDRYICIPIYFISARPSFTYLGIVRLLCYQIILYLLTRQAINRFYPIDRPLRHQQT